MQVDRTYCKMDHHIKLVLFVTLVSKQITPERRSQENLLKCIMDRESRL